MGNFAVDVRYAFRMMRANPAFTAVAVTVLALGIAANSAIFTVVDSVLLKPLPYPEPDRLMQFGRLYQNNNYGFSNSIPKYMTWRQNQVFDSITLFGQGGPGMNLGAGDRPEQVRSLRTSEGYFKVFGVSSLMGRTYTPAEDVPGGPNVTVISYSLWQNHLGGNPAIVGSSITLNGAPYTVLGVLARGFQPDPPAGVFCPFRPTPTAPTKAISYASLDGSSRASPPRPLARR